MNGQVYLACQCLNIKVVHLYIFIEVVHQNLLLVHKVVHVASRCHYLKVYVPFAVIIRMQDSWENGSVSVY